MRIEDIERFCSHLRELGRIEVIYTVTDRFCRLHIDDVEYFFAHDGELIEEYDGWATTNTKKAAEYLGREEEADNKGVDE